MRGVIALYQVLYRKYRPATFSDVCGQPQVTDTLKNEIKTGRIAHAYLFTGSRGTGKTSCAKILARAVNCLSPVDGDPCNECEVCRGIEDETILDVVEMDAASNNGVGDVRDLQEELSFTPAKAKYRVYIIDEVHMMSPSAFNALLKTLEEPPAHVVFILATTEVHKLPATILSRCQRLDFHRISAEDIAARLTFIAECEGASIDRSAALLIARIADGGMRDAVSLLDQCISRARQVTEDTVRDAAGMAGTEHIFELSEAILDRRQSDILEQISRLHEASKDMIRLCEELIAHFRALMIINTVSRPDNLIIATSAEIARLKELAGRYELPRILEIMDGLQTALERMGRGAERRTGLELALMRLCRGSEQTAAAGQAVIPEELERRIIALERAVKQGIAASPAPPRTHERTAPIPVRETNALSDSAVPFEPWSAIMQKLESVSPSLFAVLRGSRAYESGAYLLLEATDMAIDMMRQETARDTLRRLVLESTGKSFKLGPYRPSASAVPKEISGVALLAQRAESAGIPVNSDET